MCLLPVAIVSLAAVPPLDPDLWWHLSNGRLLISLGTFPHSDVYSFTATGHPWVMHEWLADLLMYGLFKLGGLPLLVAVFASIVALGATCLYALLRMSGLQPSVSVLVALVGALAGSTTWGARPQAFNLLLTGLLLAGLLWYRRGRLQAWWLCPFLWLWANLHSGFLTGVIITGLFIAGEAFDAWRRVEAMPWPRLRTLAIALAIGVALSLVNPYGLDTLLFPLGTLTSPLIQNNIQEWASPDFHTLPGSLLEVLLFLMLLGLATGRVRARSAEWLWALTLLYLALSSQRHVPLFVLAAAPLLAHCGQALLDWVREHLLAPVPQRISERVALRWSPMLPASSSRTRVVLGGINLALLAIIGAGMIAYRALPSIQSDQEAKAIAAAFPVAATQALSDPLHGHGIGVRVLNYYDYGGYLIWKTYPDGDRVFIDGRVEVYGSQVFRDYLSVNYVASDWQAVLSRYGVNAILLPRGHPLVAQLERDASWVRLAADPVAALFISSSFGLRP